MMRRILIVAVMALVATGAAWAQARQLSAGVGATYNSEIEKVGLNGRVQYGITDQFRGELSLTYVWDSDDDYDARDDMLDASLNLHYLFEIKPWLTLYPTGGAALLNYRNKWLGVTESETAFGCNVGGGVDITPTPRITVFAECVHCFATKDLSHFLLCTGLKYNF